MDSLSMQSWDFVEKIHVVKRALENQCNICNALFFWSSAFISQNAETQFDTAKWTSNRKAQWRNQKQKEIGLYSQFLFGTSSIIKVHFLGTNHPRFYHFTTRCLKRANHTKWSKNPYQSHLCSSKKNKVRLTNSLT